MEPYRGAESVSSPRLAVVYLSEAPGRSGGNAGVWPLPRFPVPLLLGPQLRRRSHVGLNKGEAEHALKRAVFFHRLGELRDRTFENQRHRASGLNLMVAAIVLWNTVYLGRAVEALRDAGEEIPAELLPHIAPLSWEHVSLTGDYVWSDEDTEPFGGFRPLRRVRGPFLRPPLSVRF
jgi:hypothetical protein